MYEVTDLTTYALCADMIGSGKTGLSIGLLEEAAIDGIPAIAVDSKGDLGNLLLQFRDFDPASFLPYISEEEAAQKGVPRRLLPQKRRSPGRRGAPMGSR